MKQFTTRLLLLLSAVMLLSSCHDEEPSGPAEWPESQHTLLIYMVGDNNLSSYCWQNTTMCINGMLRTETPVNLVIYEDSKSSGHKGTPALFRLKRSMVNPEKVDTIMIHQYETDINSADPKVFQQVVKEAFAAAPAAVKGIEMWSHGLGWAPGATYKATRAAGSNTRATQYIGIDNNDYMEIWQLREALEGCPHLDYMIFDACNMGQAEVAYELRKVCDYMLACPTEIMAAGLPYMEMIQSLSKCQNQSSLVDALKSVVDDFEHLYPGLYTDNFNNIIDGGTFALTDLRQIMDVHHAYFQLLGMCADRLTLLNEHPYTYEDEFQPYGRSGQGSRYLFYDMITVTDFLAKGAPDQNVYNPLKEALTKAVIKEYHSKKVLDFRGDMRSCGLGVALPELFQIANNTNTLRSAYQELQWSKDMPQE